MASGTVDTFIEAVECYIRTWKDRSIAWRLLESPLDLPDGAAFDEREALRAQLSRLSTELKSCETKVIESGTAVKGSGAAPIVREIELEIRDGGAGLLPKWNSLRAVLEESAVAPPARKTTAEIIAEQKPPLTDREQAVFTLIRDEGPFFGKDIVRKLEIPELSTLTGPIATELKDRGLIANRRGAGYYALQ